MKLLFSLLFLALACNIELPQDKDENLDTDSSNQKQLVCEGPFSDDNTTVEQKIRALQKEDASRRGCVNLSGIDLNNHVLEQAPSKPSPIERFEHKPSATLYGIESLASLNFDNVNLSGTTFPFSMELVWCDFSGAKGLIAEQFNYNENVFKEMPVRLNYVKFPDNFDVTKLETENREMIKVDFSNTTGLLSSHLNKSSNYKESILPENMDVSGLDLKNRNIQGIDFSKTEGLTWQQLDSVGFYNGTAFDNVILPTMDLSGWLDMSKHRFRWTDFSRTNVSKEQLETSSSYMGVIMPNPITCDESLTPKGYHVFKGQFDNMAISDPLNGKPDTDALNVLKFSSNTFTLWFKDFTSIQKTDFDFREEKWEATTSPVNICFGGNQAAFLNETVAPTFSSSTLRVSFSQWGVADEFFFGFNLVGPVAPERFGFELHGSTGDGVKVLNDQLVIGDFSSSSKVIIRKYSSHRMTDLASGKAAITFGSGK